MKPYQHTPPPRWATFVLNLLLPDEVQTPAGDYEEYYSSIAHEKGSAAAKRWYIAQLFRLISEIIIAKLYWSLVMWKNYLLVGRRNLLKNKVAASINLFGLSAAIAACVAVFLFVKDFATVDRFQENGDRIYMITHDVPENDGFATWGTSPVPLGPALKAEFPQVEEFTRLKYRRALFEYNGKSLSENIVFADDGFFNMFTFPLRLGRPDALKDESTVIISESISEKYFGSKDPLGEVITLSFEGNNTQAFVVGGVAEKFPSNSGFRFNVLISANNPNALATEARNDWGQFVEATLIQLVPGSSLESIQAAMPRFIALQNAANVDWPISSFGFENLRHKGIMAFMVRDRVIYAVEWPFMIVFALIPLFMLALSCINYVNITLASALRRLKEIGIRKVVGGSRKQLIMQFLAENMILCFISLIMGAILAVAFLVPVFNNLFVEQIDLRVAQDWGLWIFLFVLLIFVGFVSGAYPAFYISSFEPSSILRGQEKVNRSAWLTKTLMTIQFALAFVTVVVSVYLAQNNQHLMTVDWGYKPDNTLVVRLSGQDQFGLLAADLQQYPQIEVISGAQHHIGEGGDASRVNIEGEESTVRRIAVGDNYFQSMGITIRDGREFTENYTQPDSANVLVNQSFLDDAGWTDITDKTLRLDGRSVAIIGLIDNILTSPIGATFPIVFTNAAPSNFSVATLKVPGDFDPSITESSWKRLYPTASFSYFFQNEIFDISYNSMRKLNKMFLLIALLSLVIASMGLFGLASQNAVTRMKEMAVRKSLGASSASLAYELNHKFGFRLVLAASISSVLCFTGVNWLLSQFPTENIALGSIPLAAAFVLVFATASIAVFFQSRKIALINPAEVLKTD